MDINTTKNGQTSILGGTCTYKYTIPKLFGFRYDGIYGMCIDFLNGRLMAGNGSGGNSLQ